MFRSRLVLRNERRQGQLTSETKQRKEKTMRFPIHANRLLSRPARLTAYVLAIVAASRSHRLSITMSKMNLFSLVAAVVMLVSSSTLVAAPIQFAANGHYYDFIAGTFTWSDARDDAATMQFNGLSGHLATIIASQENEFILDTFDAQTNLFAWIGASDADVEADWRWVVGPEDGTLFSLGSVATAPFNFANWGPVEPSNSNNLEHYAGINLGPTTAAGTGPGEWGDGPINAGNFGGYIVEFSTSATVPEPSSLLLFCIGAFGVGIYWTIRRKPAGGPAGTRPCVLGQPAIFTGVRASTHPTTTTE